MSRGLIRISNANILFYTALNVKYAHFMKLLIKIVFDTKLQKSSLNYDISLTICMKAVTNSLDISSVLKYCLVLFSSQTILIILSTRLTNVDKHNYVYNLL